MEPEQSKEIFNAFKYTINFLKNKSKDINDSINNEEIIIIDRTNINSNTDDIHQKLNEPNNEKTLFNNNNDIQISLKEKSDTFYTSIKKI